MIFLHCFFMASFLISCDADVSVRFLGPSLQIFPYWTRIFLYLAEEPSKTWQVGSLNVPEPFIQQRYHWDKICVVLANGTVAILKRSSIDGAWALNGSATLASI
jgi:hypothetical protein